MEVHHHPDIHHKPKKWIEYFLEFMMIFLAVTMGFFAENIREKLAENERENEYMLSLAGDLRQDIAILDSCIKVNKSQIRGKDSIVVLLQNGTITVPQTNLFYNLQWRYVGYEHVLTFSKSTLTQLLNAGGLRMIQNKKVSAAIAEYANSVDHIENKVMPEHITATAKALEALKPLLETRFCRALADENFTTAPYSNFAMAPYTNPVLRTTNSDVLKDFAFTLEIEKENTINFMNALRIHLELTLKLSQLVNTEYHLANE